MGNLIIKDGIENIDFVRVTEMLSNAFWCRGISIDEVKKGSENSALVVAFF